MGHDLHITRKKGSWIDEEGPVILLEEWLDYVKSDDELALNPERVGPGKNIIVVVNIVSHPQHWPLYWDSQRGEVWTSPPDDEVVVKMVQIANVIGARVVGDEDEVYGTDPSDPANPVNVDGVDGYGNVR